MPKSFQAQGVVPERVYLSDKQQKLLTDMADGIVAETLETYETFIANGRDLPSNEWKHVKSKEKVHVYRSRHDKVLKARGQSLDEKDPSRPRLLSLSAMEQHEREASGRPYVYDDEEPALQEKDSTNTHSSSGSFSIANNCVLAQVKPSHVPLVVAAGVIDGTVEDVAFGAFANTKHSWIVRNSGPVPVGDDQVGDGELRRVHDAARLSVRRVHGNGLRCRRREDILQPHPLHRAGRVPSAGRPPQHHPRADDDVLHRTAAGRHQRGDVLSRIRGPARGHDRELRHLDAGPQRGQLLGLCRVLEPQEAQLVNGASPTQRCGRRVAVGPKPGPLARSRNSVDTADKCGAMTKPYERQCDQLDETKKLNVSMSEQPSDADDRKDRGVLFKGAHTSNDVDDDQLTDVARQDRLGALPLEAPRCRRWQQQQQQQRSIEPSAGAPSTGAAID
ncbi:hypothetical protein ON010_g3994 [Phytophthora cinnamomi]|nr:hypothetical protein ON010_g3994 [Phytophthora cinnamomi]